MIDVESGGPWPENSIADINNARIRLQDEGWISCSYYLMGPYKTLECLDTHLPSETTTYRAFLLNNNLITSVIEQKEDESFVVVLAYGTDFEKNDVSLRKAIVKINNIECKKPVAPSEFTDEALLRALMKPYAPIGIIREGAKRAFQGLQGSAIE